MEDHRPTPPEQPAFAPLWRAFRRRMLDIAFRMLLDVGEAEDVVQEAFVRLSRLDIASIEDPEGWLVVVTGRLCLDRLRTRRRRPATPLDMIDDPFDAWALEPSDRVTLVDSVTLALHSLIERLTPAERTAFVLHDVFQFPYEDIATIVGRSPGACRQLASRARRALRADTSTGRSPVDPAQQRRISEQFIRACEGGDVNGLLALLDPAVEGAGDTVPAVVVGAANVAPGILRYLGPPASPTMLHLPVGDQVGIVALRDHRVVALVLLTIEKGLVVHVHALAGPGPRAAVSTALGL